jgi:hypothetical protein
VKTDGNVGVGIGLYQVDKIFVHQWIGSFKIVGWYLNGDIAFLGMKPYGTLSFVKQLKEREFIDIGGALDAHKINTIVLVDGVVGFGVLSLSVIKRRQNKQNNEHWLRQPRCVLEWG